MDDNCWEFKKCIVKEDCPAYPNFGKVCFSVEGTLCGGEKQGKYAAKIQRCRQCTFYDKIMKQIHLQPIRIHTVILATKALSIP